MEDEIVTLKKKVSTLESIKSSNTGNADSIYHEVQQRMERSQNLMIYNIPESNSDGLNERVGHDKELVSDVFRLLDLQQEESTIRYVVRIGKSSDRARPVKVICNSNTVKLALKSRNKLRGSAFKISNDILKIYMFGTK